MKPPTIEFLEELRDRARRSGWAHDYVEVAAFVKEMYQDAGIEIGDADLEPYPSEDRE